jgi:RNA polymerase sigma-70 factor (ECF subfamily)
MGMSIHQTETNHWRLVLKCITNNPVFLDREWENIIEACKSGSREAQKELYFLTIGHLKNVLSRYCNDLNDGQDIIQTTYLKIFEKIGQFDINKGNFNAWSAKIMINEYFQLLRKRKIFFMIDDYAVEDINGNEFNWAAFTIQEVRHVINNMSKSHATLLNLYFFEQFSFSELSQLYNLKESSVRGNLTRAKRAFENKWKSINQSKPQDL